MSDKFVYVGDDGLGEHMWISREMPSSNVVIYGPGTTRTGPDAFRVEARDTDDTSKWNVVAHADTLDAAYVLGEQALEAYLK